MNTLDRRGILRRYPRISAPLQVGLCGLILTFATPLCCAIFEQRASIPVDRIEPELRKEAEASHPEADRLYYNKGL